MARSEIGTSEIDLSKLPKHKQEAINMNKLSTDGKKNNQTVNKGRQSYMAQDNVKEFNKVFMPKALGGRPCKWDSVENLAEEIEEYFDLCNKTAVVPTITSLSAWIHCDRDMIYYHANNSSSKFSGMMKNVINLCHLTLENGTVDGKVNPVTYIFMAKNYFGLRDDKQITVTPTTEQVNTPATMEALQKQIAEENVEGIDYTEK